MTPDQIETKLKRRKELIDRRLKCQREVICLIDTTSPEAKARKTDLIKEMNSITEELHKIENDLKDPCDMCEEKNFKENGEGC